VGSWRIGEADDVAERGEREEEREEEEEEREREGPGEREEEGVVDDVALMDSTRYCDISA
jgi:hypothetical protein